MHISVGHMIVLKIIQKVSFNIASEDKKLSKMPKIVHFCEFVKN